MIAIRPAIFSRRAMGMVDALDPQVTAPAMRDGRVLDATCLQANVPRASQEQTVSLVAMISTLCIVASSVI